MKKIVISQRVISADKGANRDALEQDYIKYYQKFGVILIPFPNVLEDVEEILLELKIDGIILSGGNDINPKFYGETSKEERSYADERDQTEKRLLDFAVKNKIPVLCECRGTQFLNVYFRGKLIQNIKREVGTEIEHVAANHEVEITDDSIASYLGNKFEVNSYHNQGFSEEGLSKELRMFAKAPDGIIEGIYHPSLPIAGVLWHPERESPNPDVNKRLINSFLNREMFWKEDQ